MCMKAGPFFSLKNWSIPISYSLLGAWPLESLQWAQLGAHNSIMPSRLQSWLHFHSCWLWYRKGFLTSGAAEVEGMWLAVRVGCTKEMEVSSVNSPSALCLLQQGTCTVVLLHRMVCHLLQPCTASSSSPWIWEACLATLCSDFVGNQCGTRLL